VQGSITEAQLWSVLEVLCFPDDKSEALVEKQFDKECYRAYNSLALVPPLPKFTLSHSDERCT
jgi:hypothetical protein